MGNQSDRSRILIVEDQASVASLLQEGLTDEGFEAQIAPNGETAIRLISQGWDLVILDLSLPDIQGEAILKYISQRPDYPSVLVLTARSNIEDKLSLFRQGCDDYLTKPFIFEELSQRIRALLRRSQRVKTISYAYEGVERDPTSYTLRSGEKAVVLTPKESAICKLLIAEPGRIVSRREILHSVWGLKEEPNTNFIGVHIFHLKKKFEQIGREEWMQTVRMAGFVIRNPERSVSL